jgi:hypothetical protein
LNIYPEEGPFQEKADHPREVKIMAPDRKIRTMIVKKEMRFRIHPLA